MKIIYRLLSGVMVAGFLCLSSATYAQQAKSPVVTGKDRLAQFEKYTAMKSASSFKDLKWQFLGPTNISGRCTDIAVMEPRGKYYTMYVATASGGVWKTVNDGVTWEPIFDQQVAHH